MITEERRTANIVGAFALAVTDRLNRVTLLLGLERPGVAPALATLEAYSEQAINIERLSRILELSHSATVRLVDRLEQDGLVRRQRTTRDARARQLVLTRRGSRVARRLLDAREEILVDALAPLGPGSRRVLRLAIEQMLPSVTGARVHADAACRLCDHDLCVDTEEGCPIAPSLWDPGTGDGS